MAEDRIELVDGFVDLTRRRVERGGTEASLTAREADLLAYLVARAGQTVPRDELLTEVWGYAPSVASRAVDATAARLRAKIERDREKPAHLVTVHGVGYRFVAGQGRRPTETSPHPDRPSRLFGRDEIRERIVEQLLESRLHTLVGPPGVGKTTLARAVVDDVWATDVARTVWSCRCAAARTEDDLVRTVSSALALGPNDGARAADRIGQALADRGPIVLLLDNLEQVASVAARLVTTWLTAAPELRILATSRERLAVRGERVVEVTPLDAASGRALVLAIAEDAGCPVRALALPLVDTLVERLDGLPLALELAAARLTVLELPELLERLDRRFALLRSRLRDVEPRHAALEATLDWSWDLLSADERSAWVQCSVFQAPFSLAAVESVVELEELSVLDALHALRDKSLLHLADRGRYGLLESVKAYLRGRLRDDPEARDALRSRHAAWFAERDRPNPSVPDLLVAAEWVVEEGRPDVATTLIVTLDEIQRRAGPRTALSALAHRALELAPSVPDRGRLELVLGSAALARGDLARAEAHCREVTDGPPEVDAAVRGQAWMELGRIAQRQGDLSRAAEYLEHAATLLEGPVRAWAEARLGVVLMRTGAVAEARDHYEHALGVAEAEEERSLQAFVLASLVAVGLREGRLTEAIANGRRAIDVARGAGDRSMEAIAAGNLGAVQATHGDLDAAETSYQLALSLHRRSGNEAGICSVLANLGDLALSRERHGEASEHLVEALQLARRLGERRQEGLATLNLGLVALETRPSEALQRFEDAESVFSEGGMARLASIAASYRGRALAETGDLGAAERVLEAATDGLCAVGDEMQAALARCHLAKVFIDRGDRDRAHRAWVNARGAARSLGVAEDSELGRATAALAAQLDAR